MFHRMSVSRGAIGVGLASLVLGAAALIPGGFSPARAQTAGTPQFTCPEGQIQQTDGTCTTESKTTLSTTAGTQQTTLGTSGQGSGDVIIRVAVRATFRLTRDFPNTDLTAALKTELVDTLADALGVPRARIRINTLSSTFTDRAAQPSENTWSIALTQEAGAEEIEVRVLSLLNFTITDQTGAALGVDDIATSLTFDVDAVAVALAGGDLTRLGVAYYIEAEDTWAALQCTVAGLGVTCEIPTYPVDLILYVVEQAAAPVAPQPAPTGTGTPAGADRPTPLALLAGAVLGIVALGGLGLRRARRRA
jgi:hypothetical protein